ncbi:MAG: glutamate--tRNA ligase [Candidatus Thermoplasmatota archaeon]
MYDEDVIQTTVRKFALKNAVEFNGEANVKAVMGKAIGVLKKEGFSPQEIIPGVKKVVSKVNSLNLGEQKKELEDLAPELLEKEKKEGKDKSLPDLRNAEMGSVVTRFPPEPNGYLHIGHAKASIIDSEYARKYDGKFILRFDDTNPENAVFEFYEVQKEDLRWLGIEWDEEYNTSDNIDRHYELAEKLIKQGDAYICNCPSKKIKENRYKGVGCSCRKDNSPGENLDLWREMISSSVYDSVLRLKGDMKSDNTAMRDPTLFRVIERSHPLQGEKYRVWPTYDFAGAIEDSLSGVTHPFRTKEYELRDECYFYILDLLDLRKPNLMEFARLSINGMPVSKRKIRPLIEENLVSGYDDVRLPTLRGLKRRGIVPEGIKNFVFSQGISKSESVVDFSILESENRKVIDNVAKRFFFVADPVKLKVENAPKREVKLSCHPSNEDLGFREVKTDDVFFIQRSDLKRLEVGDVFRLKDLYNVEIKDVKDNVVSGLFSGDKLISDSAKIQWTTEDYIEMNVFVPDLLYKGKNFNPDSLQKVNGFAEKAVSNLKEGEIIQFERFGFVRIERSVEDIVGFFAHK